MPSGPHCLLSHLSSTARASDAQFYSLIKEGSVIQPPAWVLMNTVDSVFSHRQLYFDITVLALDAKHLYDVQKELSQTITNRPNAPASPLDSLAHWELLYIPYTDDQGSHAWSLTPFVLCTEVTPFSPFGNWIGTPGSLSLVIKPVDGYISTV